MRTRPDYCAYCVRIRIETHGRFDGLEGLNPAVTTIAGTRVCGAHAALALADQVENERLVIEDERV